MIFLKHTFFLFLMAIAVSTVSAQTTQSAKKACCTSGSTTDAPGNKCDPKSCTPQAGSSKSCCSTAGSSSTSVTASLSPKVFKKQFKKAKNKVLIDVRTSEEFTEGHLKKAQNIDYQSDNFEDQVSKLDKSKTYFLYCRSGRRTTGAVEVMQKNGFESIVVLEGGLLAWEEQHLPVKK